MCNFSNSCAAAESFFFKLCKRKNTSFLLWKSRAGRLRGFMKGELFYERRKFFCLNRKCPALCRQTVTLVTNPLCIRDDQSWALAVFCGVFLYKKVPISFKPAIPCNQLLRLILFQKPIPSVKFTRWKMQKMSFFIFHCWKIFFLITKIPQVSSSGLKIPLAEHWSSSHRSGQMRVFFNRKRRHPFITH